MRNHGRLYINEKWSGGLGSLLARVDGDILVSAGWRMQYIFSCRLGYALGKAVTKNL